MSPAMVSEEMDELLRGADALPRGQVPAGLRSARRLEQHRRQHVASAPSSRILRHPRRGHASRSRRTSCSPAPSRSAPATRIYGPATMLVLTVGRGVDGFTLDREIGDFVLTHPHMRIPDDTREFAINASQRAASGSRRSSATSTSAWPARAGRAARTSTCAGSPRWSPRRIRILMRGGVFLYPRDTKDPNRPGGCACCTRRTRSRSSSSRPAARASTGSAARAGVQPDGAAPARAADVRLARARSSASSAITREFARRRLGVRQRRCSTDVVQPVPRPRLVEEGQPCRSSIRSSPSPAPPAPAPPRSRKTFQHIFRREGINAGVVEGDCFHRYDRKRDEARAGRGRARQRRHTSATSAPRPTCSRSSRRCSADTARRAPASVASTCTTSGRRSRTGRSRAPSRRGKTLTRGSDLLFYEGLHGAVVTDTVNIVAARRPADRRRADHQPRVDPEAAPRQDDSRLLDRGRDRHHPAPHARLRELHLPAVLPHPRQLPAGAHRGHVRSVHRAVHPDAPTRASWSSASPTRKGIDFPYLLSMLHDSFMSRPNTIVVPGGKMELAMQLIFTPLILRLMEKKRQRAPAGRSRPRSSRRVAAAAARSPELRRHDPEPGWVLAVCRSGCTASSPVRAFRGCRPARPT